MALSPYVPNVWNVDDVIEKPELDRLEAAVKAATDAIIALQTVQPPTSASPSTTAPVGLSGNWTLVFSDEFTGTTLNTAVWDPQDGYTGQNNVTVLASNVSVANSIASLTLSDSGHGAQIASVNTLFNVGDYCEFRANFPGDGTNYYNWPAVWTSGPNWPANGEIDVAEVLSSQLTYNYHGTTNSVNYPALSGYYANGWHTFGVYRHASTFDIYYDGVPVQTGMPTGDSGGAQNIIMTMGYSSSGTPGIGAKLQIDYVRTFRPA